MDNFRHGGKQSNRSPAVATSKTGTDRISAQTVQQNSKITDKPATPYGRSPKQQTIPNTRPNRISCRTTCDPHSTKSYGTSIQQPKQKHNIRIFFQNIKGLSHYSNGEDYDYYMTHFRDLQIDIAGLAETNTAWQHHFLRREFSIRAQRAGEGLAKTSFGSPNSDVDPIPIQETFQSGGTITTCLGLWTTTVFGKEIQDTTGLGRWSGLTIRGKSSKVLSVITAYRTCKGSRQTAPLGSVFHRETEFFRQQHGHTNPNPRTVFLDDVTKLILQLQEEGHQILLMLDANATLEDDQKLSDLLSTCQLTDIHKTDAAPSTYIGSATRRIDFMFGCAGVTTAVTRHGTLAYHEGPQSDHRGLYVDIDAFALLHHLATDNTIQPPQARVLKTGNPESVALYHSHMMEYYHQHNMVERITWLHEQHETMSEDKVRKLLEQWDTDQGRAMKSAEKKINGTRLKKHYWSPTLRNAGLLCRYWCIRIHAHKTNRDPSESINRIQEMIRQHDPHHTFPLRNENLSLQAMTQQWKQAKNALKECQNNARELRYSCYEDMLAQYIADPSPENVRRAKIVNRTIKTERCREMYRTIRFSTQPPNSETTRGLSSILVPTIDNDNNTSKAVSGHNIYSWLAQHPDGSSHWERVIDSDEVERMLLQYNHASFQAASASPCGHGKILKAITFTTLSKAGKDLLDGTFPADWHKDNILLQEFLKSFSIPPHAKHHSPIPTGVSMEDVKQGFSKWREKTSTSPSGRHLGHYKSIVQHEVLLECLTKFLDIVFQRGIPILRWQQATNVMLEKDHGRPAIHRLRIIHLFEADLNFFLKLMWGRRLVRRAQETNMLNTGQYGSVPGRTAIELVMLNQLSNDICRTNKINIIRFDNDASACYDRILVHLGMLAARRCGMPENAVRIHADTLQNMKYSIKTTYGISKSHYHGTSDKPLFGTGQGSGASPAVWLSLVVILMNTLDRLTSERIRFKDPDNSTSHSRLIDAFVDDTSLSFNDMEAHMSFSEMTQKMEQIAQNWENLLYFSGGALNLKKCSWNMLYWTWEKGRPRLHDRPPENQQIQLYTQGKTTDQVIIKYTPPDKSNRILGVYLNPMGDFTEQLTILKEKSDKMAHFAKASRISASNMRIFIRTMYQPAMQYALPAVATDEENMQLVQSRMLATALQKLGASKTTPTAIRHGPIELGGLNLPDLRTELGISGLRFLRNAIYKGTEAGKLIILSVKFTQLEAGIPHPILERPDILLPYITATWVTSIRQFLYQHNLTVNLTEKLRIQYNGTNDRCIMDTSTIYQYTPAQQRDINLVRLYLQVMTLSDLSNADGKTINADLLQGVRAKSQTICNQWPRQEMPTISQRRLWRRYISSNFLRYGLYWRNPLVRKEHRIPTCASPAAITAVPDSLCALPETSGPINIQQYVSSLPKWHRRLLSNFTQLATDVEVWRAFRSRRRITIASDGGLKQQVGTFGWKIVNRSRVILFQGSGPVDGPSDIGHSTRSELGGLTAPLLLCVSLSKFWGLAHKCRYTWLTDSKVAISKVTFITKTSYQPRIYPDDADYITAIHALHRSLGGRKLRQIQWVKGHQDDDKDYSQLTPEAQLNVDVDALASDHFWSGKGKKPVAIVPHLSEQKITIQINGVTYPSKIDQQLRYHINGSYLKAYLQNLHGWSDLVWQTIDIEAFGKHFKSLNDAQQIQQMKFVYNLQSTGRRKQKIQHTDDHNLALCPCCNHSEETQRHMLLCENNPSHTKATSAFKTSCQKSDSNKFKLVLSDLILQWLINPSVTPQLSSRLNPFLRYEYYPAAYTDLISLAIREQDHIGWMNILRGFFSKTWCQVASTYFDDSTATGIINRKDGTNRVHQMLKALQKLTSTIWQGRNEVLHATSKECLDQHRTAIDLAITRYHEESNLVLADDRFYCETSLQRLLRSSLSNKRRWLHRVKVSRAKKAHLHKRQPTITTYFPSKEKPPLNLPEQSTPSPAPKQIRKHTSRHLTKTLQMYCAQKDHTGSSDQLPKRTITTQQLLTHFLKERAPNTTSQHCQSPPPTQH